MNAPAASGPPRHGPGRPPLGGVGLAAVLLLYPLLWWLGLEVSNAYWFLPVGLRVAALMRVPARWWWALLLGEYLAGAANTLWHGYPLGVAGALFGSLLPFGLYAGAVAGWRKVTGETWPTHPRSFGQLLLAGASAAALTALDLTLLRWLDGRLGGQSPAEVVFSLLVGDLVGVVMLGPLLLQLGDPRAAWRRLAVWREIAWSVLPLGLVLILIGRSQPEVQPYVALFALAPPLWLGYRAGWRGASLAFALASTAVYASSGEMADPRIESLLQFYLALVGIAGLVLGAVVSFEQRLRERLRRSVGELAAANRRLTEQALEVRELGQRLVAAQENERQRIRSDLRGEFSQQISVLSTELSLLVRQVDRPELMAMLDALRAHVLALRDAAEACLDNLQPRGLAEGRLREAILETPLARSLHAAGVRFELDVREDAFPPDAGCRIHTFRIAQHLMALALRFSDCTQLRLALEEEQDGEGWIGITARIVCRTPLMAEAVAAEPEWQAVRDRMFAVGGEVGMEPAVDGALQLCCRFPSRDGAPGREPSGP